MPFTEDDRRITSERLEPDKKRRERVLPAVVLAILALLAVTGTLFFYQYLERSIFQERQSHFVELSGRVSQVMESVVSHFRSTSEAADRLLEQGKPQTQEALLDQLSTIQACLGVDQALVLDSETGHCTRVLNGMCTYVLLDLAHPLALDGVEDRALVERDIGSGCSYVVFLGKLSSPLDVERQHIDYAGAAVDLSTFQEAFDADIFQGNSHVYVIGPDGEQLYRHQCDGGFIDDPNLLTALERYPFLHGGTLEDLRQDVAERRSAGYEFDYGPEHFFVAASPVAGTDWTVLSFVPTRVLGAGTTSFLNTSVVCVSAIAAVVVLMMGIVLHLFTAKRGDQRLIAHQQRANTLLQIAADAANAANVAKSEFLSHMSHDIRTPINGIMGMTEIALKHMNNPERVYDCLSKIKGSSGHLLSLVNDVLDMSRIESGKTHIAQEPMDLRQVVEHCASIVIGHLQGRDVTLVEEFAPLEHPRVLGDELHLRQVLVNILGNAVKFTSDGGHIYFRCRETSAEGNTAWFRLEVEDTGIGMKPEFLPHIFDAFAQEDGGTRTSYKGTGLGMSITKKFVDLMEGTITVESQLNVGSRFVVEIPLLIDQTVRQDEVQAEQTDLAGVRLLLAEDNELNMEIAQYMLEDMGAEFVAVPDGEAALNAFSHSEPGYFAGILMDVMMPVMDGLTATRAIRALDRPDAGSIPIIAMTANAYDEDKRRCLEAGMSAHLPKPIDSVALAQVLTAQLNARRPHCVDPSDGLSEQLLLK